jgi:glycosyltransferase involved in cell wall biosynthesis
MKIVMFTPMAPTSAIGRVAKWLTDELLARQHEVVIIRTEDVPYQVDVMHDFVTRYVAWQDTENVESFLYSADCVIYQIGNHYEFHRGSLEWLPRTSGIVCLHDFYLGCLFWGWAEERRDIAVKVVEKWYGLDIANRYFTYPSSTEFFQATATTAPMTEWIVSMSSAVITHANWDVPRVLQVCPGPVHCVPLAYQIPGVVQSLTPQFRQEQEFNLLTIGYMNFNKKIPEIIQAIASEPHLQQVAHLRLVGEILPEIQQQWLDLAQELAVKVTIYGKLDDQQLQHAVLQADVMCCLRQPTFEAASASVIEAMLYGKAAIVTDLGFYRELPDDCVFKVSSHNLIDELQQTLTLLLNQPKFRTDAAEKAQRWAQKVFNVQHYANKVIEMAHTVTQQQPLLQAADFFVQQLENWSADSVIYERCAATLTNID